MAPMMTTTTRDIANAVPPPPPSQWFTHIDADETTLSVTYRGRPVWKDGDVPTAAGPTFLQDLGLESTRDGLIIVCSSSSSSSNREKLKGHAAQMSPTAVPRFSIDAEALVRLVNECGGDGEWADHVAYLANYGKRLGGLSAEGQTMLQQHVFPPLSGTFLCFAGLDANGQGVYKADQSVWSGFNCRWTRVDDKGRISEIMEDSEFSCEPGAALCAAARGLVLGTMALKANRVCIDQNDMFNCVVLTSITAVTLVTRGAAAQVAVPFVLNVGQAAYLYVTAMRNDMEAPQVRRVLLAELTCLEQRVVLVASLAALLRRMRDVANGNRVRVLLLELGEKKVESSRRCKGSSSATHSAPYDSSDEHS